MIIDQALLAKAASSCAKVVGSTGYPLQIEGGDGVTVKAANGQQWLTLTIDGEGDPFGEIHIDASTFAGVVAGLSSGAVDLTFAAGKLAVASGRGRRTLTLRHNKLPDRPFEAAETVAMDGAAIRDAIAFTLPHASPPGDPVKWFAAGVHLRSEGGALHAYATDGKTLAVAKVCDCAADIALTIDHKTAELLGAAPDGSISLEVGTLAVRIIWPGLELVSSIIDGIYPIQNIRNATSLEWDKTASFEAPAFLSAVRGARLLGEHDTSARSERLSLTINGVATLTAKSASGEAVEEFPADYEGEEFSIGIIASQTERVMRGFGDAVLNASFKSDIDPIRLVPAGRTDRLALLYPVRM